MSKRIHALYLTFILIAFIPLLVYLPQASSEEFPRVEAEKIISPQKSEEGDTVDITIRLRGAGGVILTPVDVVLILDRSGSMSGQKLKDAQEAAVTFLDFNDDKDRVGLVTYSSDVDVDSDLEFMNPTNKELLQTKIEGFKASGATNIFDAMVAANEILLDSPRINAPAVAILLTDGLHNFPTELPDSDFEDLANEANDNGIIYYTIGLGDDVNSDRLRMIAEICSGQYFFAPTSDELLSIFTEIASMLSFAGTNIEVTETIPSYMSYNDDASITPDEETVLDGEIDLFWDVGTLAVGDEWEVSYTARAEDAVESSDLVVQARVEYITAEAATAIINLTPGLIFHDISVTLLEAKPDKIPQGNITDITATVKSDGIVRDNVDVDIRYNGTLLSSQSVTLDPGQSRNVTFAWNTSDIDIGKYNITVQIDPDEEIWEQDRSDNEARVEVEITQRITENLIWVIIIFLMILIIMMAGVAVAKKRLIHAGPTCPHCGDYLTFDSRSGQWYCPRCGRYVTV